MQYARKLQKVGAGTLTVSLPSRWVKSRGLTAGQIVELTEMADGSLRISTEAVKAPKHTAITFDAAKFQDRNLLGRLIVGAYLQGAEEIKIFSGEGLSADLQNMVNETLEMLPGVEVVEQTYRRIIAQSFIDPDRFPIEALLKRIQVMLTSILNNLSEAVRTGKKSIIEDIRRIENKIDELYFLCVRQIFIDVKTKSQVERAPEHFLTAIGDRLVVRALEEMADSVRMAADETALLDENTPEHVRQRLSKLIEYVQVLLGKTMKAFFSLDITLANEIIETARREFGEHI
ncbi:MAG: phosphate uptake regulator PhoU, partial [Nitrososphaerota archaeon]